MSSLTSASVQMFAIFGFKFDGIFVIYFAIDNNNGISI